MAITKPTVNSFAAIPAELKERHQWVVYRLPEKIPLQINDVEASITDDRTWATFDDAARAVASSQFHGIDFVFSATDPFAGIDLDGCRNPDTGELAEWAQAIIADLDSYTEVSPSKTGVKIIVRGTPCHTGGKNKRLPKMPRVSEREPGIETYSEGRYFCLTGKVVSGHSTINERTTRFNAIRAKFWPTRKPKPKPTSVVISNGNIDRCRKYIAKMPAGISGQGGHNATFAVACELFRFGLSDSDARALFDDFNARCEPPWDDHQLQHKLDDAKECVDAAGEFGCRVHESNGRAISAPSVAGAIEHAVDLSLADTRTWSDTGNAKRFVRLHGENIRWCDPWQKWLVFDGTRWVIDETRHVEHLAKDVSATMFAELGERFASMDEKRVDAAMRFIKATANERNIRAFLTLAKSETGIALMPDVFDRDAMLFNVANGTLELRTGKLREHRREDFLTKLAGVAFDADAESYQWDQFLERIFDGKQELIDYARRLTGYCLTGSVQEQVLPIFWGGGANGKSTYINTIMAAMGHYAIKAPHNLLIETGERHPTELADLQGRRLVACVETGEGKRLAETLVKELTGGEAVRARRMREDFWQFDPTHKIIVATNHKPRVVGTDKAIWRRLKLVPFIVTIPDVDQDKTLPAKLLLELPGVLAWAVRGCLDWQRQGLGEPHEVKAATAEYRASQDTLASFLSECCVVSERAVVRLAALRKRYGDWCEEHDEKPVSGRRFGEFLGERFTKRTSNGTIYEGLRLLE